MNFSPIGKEVLTKKNEKKKRNIPTPVAASFGASAPVSTPLFIHSQQVFLLPTTPRYARDTQLFPSAPPLAADGHDADGFQLDSLIAGASREALFLPCETNTQRCLAQPNPYRLRGNAGLDSLVPSHECSSSGRFFELVTCTVNCQTLFRKTAPHLPLPSPFLRSRYASAMLVPVPLSTRCNHPESHPPG